MGIRIVFTGDISFSKHFENAWQRNDVISAEVWRYINAADHVIANVECPLTNRSIDSKRTLNHSCPPDVGVFLKNSGIKYWSLANNHIMDCGADGLNDTLICAKENGCQAFGAGKNIKEASRPIIIGDDVKIGVLSMAKPWSYLIAGKNTPGALTWKHETIIKKRISSLRAKGADWIVLIVHGGDEYADIALPYMREQYHKLLGMGADIIVAHHPHVVQNYEFTENNKAIFYSLGNFIFDTDNQRKFDHTDAGILLGIDFNKDTFTFDHLPIHIDRRCSAVKVGDTPVVFCDFTNTEYERLWPLEARNFYPVDFLKRKLLSYKMSTYPRPLVLAHEVYICCHKRERTIQYGRFLSYLGGWKLSDKKDVICYINDSSSHGGKRSNGNKADRIKLMLKKVALKVPAVRRKRAKRTVEKINRQYLSKAEIELCERDSAKKSEIVKRYFELYPDRFLSDIQSAEKQISGSPYFAEIYDKEAMLTELLFYRIAYGFHPEEYSCFELRDRTEKERSRFVSSRECSNYVYRMNDKSDIEVFNNKGKTYQKFGRYYNREAVYIEDRSDYEKYRRFVEKHPVFVKKSVFEAMGRSIEKIDISEHNMDKLFDELIGIGAHILEECVQQSGAMAALNLSSVNTVRSITFNTRHGIMTPYYFIKIGRAGSFVDNGGAGGILVGIDADTGKLCTDGFDEMNNRYSCHPDSGVVFQGYQLPEWEKLKALSKHLSAQMPTVKYIGWDLAHTDSGWVIIEGNGRSQMIGPQIVFKRGIKCEVQKYMHDMDLIF